VKLSVETPSRLSAALKEWAAVCRALGEGRQSVLLRKGGLVERADGFALESPWFFLLPTLEHQTAADFREGPVAAPGGPPQGPFPLELLARAEDVRPLSSLDQARRALPFTVYTEHFLEKRWNYRTDRTLFLLVLRVFRRTAPVTVPADPRYAGCASWTDLARPLPTEGFSPVLPEDEFERRRRDVLKAVA
jgi:hypothetical protein